MSELYKYWFSTPRLWFSATEEDNKYLEENFDTWVKKYESMNPRTIEDYMTLIILYDQIPRNIKKNNKYYEALAKHYVKELKYISKCYNILTAIEWCFAMLPYRHTNCDAIIHGIIENAWVRIRQDPNNTTIYTRFLKASYERCPITDLYIRYYEPQEVIWNMKIYLFLLDYIPEKGPSFEISNNEITREFISMIEKTKPRRVIISLSGGVDSMVSSLVLKRLSQKYNFELIAVHINYANRRCCGEEEDYLKHWCSFLNIPLHIREIKEIHREICKKYGMREIYESYTRDVRFMTYKLVWGNESPAYVVLGHNRDDIFENIMTNIAQKTKYDMLDGMIADQEINNIRFIRPLLNISKAHIYKFAEENNVPYLPTSTPKWSMRGKIRDIVKPAVKEWHPESIEGFMNLSRVMTDMYKLLEIQIRQAVKNTEQIDNTYIYNFTRDTLPTQYIFWHGYIDKLLGVKISVKSAKNLEWKLENWKEQKIRLPLTKNIFTEFTDTKMILKRT